MPFIMFWVQLTGQPVVITLVPNEAPSISFPAPAPIPRTSLNEPASCRYVVCKT